MSGDKEHYTNLHWGDWFKDTAALRPATRGIWIDLIGVMANRQSDRVHSEFERLPFVLRATTHDIMLAALDLAENDCADVFINGKPILEWRSGMAERGESELDFVANSLSKSYLTVICRRRSKELMLSKVRSEAGRKGMDSRYKGINKEPNKSLTTAGNGNGNGNIIDRGLGEDENRVEIPPAKPKLDELEGELIYKGKEINDWTIQALRVFEKHGPIPIGSTEAQIVKANCAELVANGKPKEKFDLLCDWTAKSENEYRPKDAASMTDPLKWTKWQQSMEDEIKRVSRKGKR